MDRKRTCSSETTEKASGALRVGNETSKRRKAVAEADNNAQLRAKESKGPILNASDELDPVSKANDSRAFFKYSHSKATLARAAKALVNVDEKSTWESSNNSSTLSFRSSGVNDPKSHGNLRRDEQAESDTDDEVVFIKSRPIAFLRKVNAMFCRREYRAPQSPFPLEGLYGARGSKNTYKEAQLWYKNQVEVSLLRLPEHVRRRIYDLILGGNTIRIVSQSSEGMGRKLKYSSVVDNIQNKHNPFCENPPADVERTTGMTLLNGVCRQLHIETSLLPYQLNVIAFDSNNTMLHFLAVDCHLTQSQRGVIKKVLVRYDIPGLNIIQLLPNLERLHCSRPDDGSENPKGTILRKPGWREIVYEEQ